MRARIAVLLAAAVTAAFLAAPAMAQGRTHVVQPGENLYRIALRYSVSVDDLMRVNGLVDPRQLRVGQVLVIPGPAGPAADVIAPGPYVVRPGDTLYGIARRAQTTVRVLMEANGLRSEAIFVGQLLIIPGGVESPPPAPVQVVDPQLLIGTDLPAPRPLRVRRGPRTYETTLALVAADTPLRIVDYVEGWFSVVIPGGDMGWVRETDLAASGRSLSSLPQAIGGLRGSAVVQEALKYLGTRYVWGGASARGLDCSGFVYVVLSSYVPGLTRVTSFDFFKMGQPVGRDALQPGDLVFFTTYAPGPSHVGIHIGEGKFIQASSSQGRVAISSLSEAYYAARYLGARRLTKP
ncbi:MAG: LysM peptidoglycan-binding domain-containing protein [bacterium]